MAIPETSRHNQAIAVNNSRMAWNFDCGGWPNGKNAARMCKDCTIFDGRFSGRRINFCVNQSEVRAKTRYAGTERPDKKNSENISDSHASNIRQGTRLFLASEPQRTLPLAVANAAPLSPLFGFPQSGRETRCDSIGDGSAMIN